MATPPARGRPARPAWDSRPAPPLRRGSRDEGIELGLSSQLALDQVTAAATGGDVAEAHDAEDALADKPVRRVLFGSAPARRGRRRDCGRRSSLHLRPLGPTSGRAVAGHFALAHGRRVAGAGEVPSEFLCARRRGSLRDDRGRALRRAISALACRRVAGVVKVSPRSTASCRRSRSRLGVGLGTDGCMGASGRSGADVPPPRPCGRPGVKGHPTGPRSGGEAVALDASADAGHNWRATPPPMRSRSRAPVLGLTPRNGSP